MVSLKPRISAWLRTPPIPQMVLSAAEFDPNPNPNPNPQMVLCAAEFDAAAFAVHASTLFEGLFRLFGLLCEGGSLLSAIELLTTMLGMLGEHAAQVAAAVAGRVPSLWDQATSESNAVKSAIIQAVTTLVNASPEACAALGHVAVPMVRFSINTANAEEVVFGEDGIALWRAAIKSLPQVH